MSLLSHSRTQEGPGPQLTAGAQLVGPYQDSGLIEETFLARTPAGNMVQLSGLLFTLLSALDGRRSSVELAHHMSHELGRTVSADNVDYLLANKLLPTGLVTLPGGEVSSGPLQTANGVVVLKGRRTLLRPRWVQAVARVAAPLFFPVIVAGFLLTLLIGDAWLLISGTLRSSLVASLTEPSSMLAAFVLSVVSMIFHEFGHAAACKYGGAAPGKIGGGLFLVWPAMYTDVTDSYRLNRRGRLRVDLGGVYFNAVFSVVLLGLFLVTGNSAFVLALVLIHAEMLEQLLPTLWLDGHLILSDIIGVPDLFGRIGPVLKSIVKRGYVHPQVSALKRGARIVVITWVLGTALLIAAELVLLAFYGPELVSTFLDTARQSVRTLMDDGRRGHVVAVIGDALMLLVFLLPALGALLIASALLRQAAQMARSRFPRRKEAVTT